MNKAIESILNGSATDEGKRKQLDVLSNEIQIAKDIMDGKYKYCHECNDYYITESFLTRTETRETKICTYNNPINSGGNDYADGYVDITYSVCPKGHKHEISRNERLR